MIKGSETLDKSLPLIYWVNSRVLEESFLFFGHLGNRCLITGFKVFFLKAEAVFSSRMSDLLYYPYIYELKYQEMKENKNKEQE